MSQKREPERGGKSDEGKRKMDEVLRKMLKTPPKPERKDKNSK
jgi:hypothetical protein